MVHLPGLIEDLALILIAAAITTLLFRRIRQPLVLGYIIAGFLVGPHLSLTPSVVDTDNVKVLAEMGVIFLLFSLGLEFSFKKLVRVGGSASITAMVEIVFITTAGYYLGRWMDWSVMDSLFLGGMLASSSTTIIIKAFDELGLKTKQYARVVFGVLIVEDIVVIMLMVLLSTVAVTRNFEGGEMLFTVAKLLFFLGLWFITGIFLIPSFLKRAKRFLDDETLLVLSTGLCLGMVVVAVQAGFSAELGAFVMGSILAETTKAEKIEHILKPVKDLFGAIFFVSVGMLINPQVIIEYAWPVFFVTVLTLAGKFLSTTAGAIMSGQPLKQAIHVGMSMAQIGEFAFIVATLGLSLGVISDFLFPVAVGASAITTFTTPYMIRWAPAFYNKIEKVMPQKWLNALNNYSASAQKIQAESAWRKVLKSYVNIIVTNSIILIGLMLVIARFLIPVLNKSIDEPLTRSITGLVISLLISSPFLWALMVKKPTNTAYKELWTHKRYSRGPLLLIELSREILGVLIIGFWVDRLFSGKTAVLVVVPIIIVVFIIFSRRIQAFYNRLEIRFLTNLHARDKQLSQQTGAPFSNGVNTNAHTQLSPWDAHIIDLEVNPQAWFIGEKLIDLRWRETFGINIAYIKRGDQLIYAPNRNNRLLPFDQVGIIATDEQIQQFKPVFENSEGVIQDGATVEDIILHKFVVNAQNQLKGQTIRESKIREKTSGLVVGIERDNQRILNPDSSTTFMWNDIVWIVGDRKKILTLAYASE